MQNRQLQKWLNDEEYEQLEYAWQEQLELRSELNDKPNDLKRYEEKVKQATFNNIRTGIAISVSLLLLIMLSLR